MFVAHLLKESLLRNSVKVHQDFKPFKSRFVFTADESSYICENPKKTPKLKSINKESDTVVNILAGERFLAQTKNPP